MNTIAPSITVTNPRTGDVAATIPSASADEVDAAIARAEAAWPAWAALSGGERAAALRAAAAALRTGFESIVEAEFAETGQPRDQIVGAVEAAIGNWEHFAECLEAGYGFESLPGGGAIHRRPLGVGAVIVPWNYPTLIAFRFIPGMLAVGNTVIWKPSEKTPLSAVAAMNSLQNALPADVLTMLVGAGDVGARIIDDSRVAITAFTGSTATGRAVAAASARMLRPVLLELGGKDPVIVDRDVDIPWAARLIADGCYTNTGQICTSIERIYVHREIAEPLLDELVTIARDSWRSAEDGGPLGPMVDRQQRATVERHVRDAVEKGATVLLGGVTPDGPGSYYPATVLTGVDHSMEIMTAETFGPVAAVQVVDSMEQAVQLARDTTYGLALTVLTRDRALVDQLVGSNVGTIWINTWHGYEDGALHQPGGSSGTGAVGWRGSEFLDAVSAPTFVSGDRSVLRG